MVAPLITSYDVLGFCIPAERLEGADRRGWLVTDEVERWDTAAAGDSVREARTSGGGCDERREHQST